jgi:hypothetical protein
MTDDEKLDRILRENEIRRRIRDEPINRASRARVAAALTAARAQAAADQKPYGVGDALRKLRLSDEIKQRHAQTRK